MSKTYSELQQLFPVLRKTYSYMAGQQKAWVDFYSAKLPDSLCYAACGSGHCLNHSAESSVRMRLGKAAWSVPGGDLYLNFDSYKKALANALLVTPSRSGSTSEVVAAVKRAKQAGDIRALSISLVAGAPLSSLADYALEMPWAFNAAVCQTSSIQSLYLANLMLVAQLAGDDALLDEIDRMIDRGEAYTRANEDAIRRVAEKPWDYAVLLADGEAYGLAMEGAMAFAEIAQMKANAYHLLDVRHGPAVLLDERTMVLVQVNPEGFALQQQLVCDLKRRGAVVVAFSAQALPLEGADLHVVFGMPIQQAASAMPFLYVAQALSLFRAEATGVDPDSPTGLSAWIELDI